MKRSLLILLLLLVAGCERDNGLHEVVADIGFWSCDPTGKYCVQQGNTIKFVSTSYAEADSVCQVLNERLEASDD